LFEGLCRHWGFYFVAACGGDETGSRDLEITIRHMSMSSGWIYDTFEDRDPRKVSRSRSNNERIAITKIAKVVLARWIVFDVFIKVAKDLNGGVLPDNIRHHWLLFQVLPDLDRNPDLFMGLINLCLYEMTMDEFHSLKSELTLTDILGPAFNHGVDSFFYVLDEAQVAGREQMGSFSDADGRDPQPVLHPILRHLTSASYPGIKTIVSGTGFSLGLFRTILMTSSVGKNSLWSVVHTTGDFANRDTQFAYISRYLPPSFLLSQSGDILKTRMYELLRGRYVVAIVSR
jgi:hypothetical protein